MMCQGVACASYIHMYQPNCIKVGISIGNVSREESVPMRQEIRRMRQEMRGDERVR